LDIFGLDLVTPNQRHRSQDESAELTVQYVQAVVFAVIAVITIIALTIYSISSMF
jgi:hypothetical protein